MITEQEIKLVIQTVRDQGLACRFDDTQKSYHFGKESRNEEVNCFLDNMATAKLVITDRLHGMVFAVLTGTPCIVFSNYNNKIVGTYEWIKDLNYIHFIDDIEDLAMTMETLLTISVEKYDSLKLSNYYDELSKVFKI